MSKEQCDKVIALFNKASNIRTNWETYWQELAKFVQPMKNNPYGFRTKGDKRGDELLDATAIHSNELLASALHSMLTNPSVPWFSMTTGIEEIDRDDDARLWLSDAVRTMHNVLNNSNFQTEIHEVYLDQGSFGTGALSIEEDEKTFVRFQARSIFEIYVLENNKGEIDTVFRKFKMNFKQLVEAFGEKWIPQNEYNEYNNDPFNKEYEVIHCVMPREGGYTYEVAKTAKDYKFASCYCLKDKCIMLQEGGYAEFPFAIPRWTKIAGEVWGRSPAMKALPEIKMINKMMEVTIKAAQLQIAPPLAVPDDGYILPVKMQPFGITYYRSGTQDEIKPLFQNLRLDLSLDMVNRVAEKIRQAFFIDQLQLREADRMTATEVNRHTEDQLRLLGPILGRQHNELLKPLIERVFAICLRRNLFKKVPAILAKREVNFIYSSQIAKVQRTQEVATITSMINSIAPILQSQPEALDYIDGDKTLQYAASAFMLPASLLRKKSEVESMRQAKQQAMQQKAREQQGMQQAQMMRDMAPMIGQME